MVLVFKLQKNPAEVDLSPLWRKNSFAVKCLNVWNYFNQQNTIYCLNCYRNTRRNHTHVYAVYDTKWLVLFHILKSFRCHEAHPLFINIMMTYSNGNIFRVTGPLWQRIQRPSVDCPHKGQLRGALVFSLNCAWTNGWKHAQDAGGFRYHCVRYDVTIMIHGDTRSTQNCDVPIDRFVYYIAIFQGGCNTLTMQPRFPVSDKWPVAFQTDVETLIIYDLYVADMAPSYVLEKYR